MVLCQKGQGRPAENVPVEYVQGAPVAGEGTNEQKDILTRIFFSQPFPLWNGI
jgi:hypothetical protein